MNKLTFLSADKAISTTGFWSGKTVLANTTEHPIWLGERDLTAIGAMLDEMANMALLHYFRFFSDKLSTLNLTALNGVAIGEQFRIHSISTKRAIEAYALAHGCTYRTGSMGLSEFATYISKKCTTPSEVSDVFFDVLKQRPEHEWRTLLKSEIGLRIDTPAVMCRIDWKQWVKDFDSIEDLLSVMLHLSTGREELTLSKAGKDKFANQSAAQHEAFKSLATIVSTIPVTGVQFGASHHGNSSPTVVCMRGTCSAMEWALLMLCGHKHLLLPSGHIALKLTKNVAAYPLWSRIAEHFSLSMLSSRAVFQMLIQSSTISGVEDISVELCRAFISNAGSTKSIVKGITASIQRYQIAHPDKPPFPVAQVNIRRQLVKKEEHERAWSPEQIRIAGYPDWAFAAEVFYRLHPGRTDSATIIMGRLIEWTVNTGRSSPWHIKAIDLIDPLHPDNQSTFFAHLSRKYANRDTARVTWWESSRFFSLTINALKPLPEYEQIIGTNPFDGLSNPFASGRTKRAVIGKTFRRLMPADHLSAMLDTLLEPDEAGVPTFAWAKKRFAIDTTERYNHTTKQYDITWHPARAICLAILLLIPIRGKQARWLDQGLMDAMRWNVDTDAWEVNRHPLRKYTYPGKVSHTNYYGRDSGVLQPVESLLGGNIKHIGLYISTNKTQLWNPEARTGYAIPWPDGAELLSSEDPRVRTQGWRLGLVYTLIKQQIRWMETYDPKPIPVDFTCDGERYSTAIARNFPKFCPIFRDISSPAEDNEKQTIYPPVSKQKLEALYHALAEETERRLIEKGYPKDAIGLTVQAPNSTHMINLGRPRFITRCAYDVHSLRVAGITHLLEMGVPAHIVSEFIAGHMALVMTLHYAKFQPLKLRQKILDAFRESDAIDQFESLLSKSGVGGMSSLLVRNRHYAESEAPEVSELLASRGVWRYINGGICPGGACDEGGARMARKESASDDERIAAPVPGGAESCGNCRFFLTGPAFLVPQMLVANAIMLQMRQLGHSRRKLWDDKAALELALFEKSAGGAAMPTSELATINGELERIDRALEPLILEWCNRYEMFQSSLPMLDEWNRAVAPDTQADRNKLVLFGSGRAEDFSAALDPKGCDFSLAKQIVLQSEMLGGRRMVSDLADYKLREFVDRILVKQNVRDLMLSIEDEKQRRTASLMMAEAISVLAGGDRAAQDLLDDGKSMEVNPEQQNVLSELARAVSQSTDAAALREFLEPINLLENSI